MNNAWFDLLKSSNIDVPTSSSDVAEASVPMAEDVPQLVDLSGLSILEITGEDASSFLQGQFCNDLNQVSATQAQLTGYCTPKGRLLALPTIVGFEQGFRLLMPAELKEAFTKRLSMFIMRSRVTLTEREDWICTGIVTDRSGALGSAAAELGSLPAAPMDAATSQTQQIIQWQGDHSDGLRARYLVLASVEDQIRLWQAASRLPRRSQSTWRLGDISAGVPSITGGTLEAFVPQMINLQLINGLSFTKGCYPGQEIVARMQYLGKLKRHMRLFVSQSGASSSSEAPVPGDALSTASDDNAGVVVDAVLQQGGGLWLLAVVKVSANEETLFCRDRELEAHALPYELPSLVAEQSEAG